ncbi:MAG: UMP kinase [Alphaproteobacteria bacterium]|jgi:uridylate kinase|nr:UMP kinase [Alphaproteobacteria bacterium]
MELDYKRILLKLSGEALSEDKTTIISKTKLNHFVNEIIAARDLGIEVIVVIGGGNIMRGANCSDYNLTRYKADNLGMLATVMNAIVLEDTLSQRGIPSVVLSAIEMNKICEFYTAQKANEYLSEGRVVICGGGIANPYFSTDTGTVVRALETGCDAVFKGTQVDGIYSDDPKINKNAIRHVSISYDEVIIGELKVMDASSILLAKKGKDKGLPIIVFNIHNEGSFRDVLKHKEKRSIIN